MNVTVRIRNNIRELVLLVQHFVLVKFFKMDIHSSAKISFGARLDKTNPAGIHIGEESYIAGGAIVFSHDYARGLYADTYIGKKCFIGANAIIMPGVIIGDSVIIGAGSVVTKDVSNGCMVAGNPAKIIKNNIRTTLYGKLLKDLL